MNRSNTTFHVFKTFGLYKLFTDDITYGKERGVMIKEREGEGEKKGER